MAENSRIDPDLLEAWVKHEDIAMHFNQMILKVRIQALGALAAIITIGGIVLKAFPQAVGTASSSTVQASKMPWELAAGALSVLLVFWVAIWVLDFLYYNRLLKGAVDAILKLENEINSHKDIEIVMSHKIEDAVRGRGQTHLDGGMIKGPLFFYLIVAMLLVLGILFSLCKCSCGS